MNRRILLAAILLALASTSLAQTSPVGPTPVGPQAAPNPVWISIVSESATTSVMLPAGTIYRLGDYTNNRWSTNVMVTVDTIINPVSMGGTTSFPFDDPDPGVVKELDVQETSSPQLITITDMSVSPATVTSRVVPVLNSVPVGAHTVTFTNFVNNANGANSLMFAFVNAPYAGGAAAWEGTAMDMTIDGVVWTCTYGQSYTDQTFSLSCAPPTP